MFNIQEELRKLPQKPGVYLMKDENENIIYVGKSINLRNRVRQYFQQSSHNNVKTKMLSVQIKSFEYIVTTNEIEALILENNLIKSKKPRYNIALKDDKTYPYIKVTNEMYPRVIKTRNVSKDNATYFGPYNDFVANETISIIHAIWPIRTSRRIFPRDLNKGRPCLNYHIGKCKAPCMQYISQEDYNNIIKEVLEFLESKYDDLIKSLTSQMKQASENLNYEVAASLRDRIEAIKNLRQKQSIDTIGTQDQDVIALAREGKDALIQIFFIRNGKMTGRESIFLESVEYLNTAEIITGFVKQFYSDTSFIPNEIITEEEIEEKKTILQWLATIRGYNVKIIVPKKGNKHKLVQLAKNNAVLTLDQFYNELKRQKERTTGAVFDISQALQINNINRIEAYDISNIQGYENVGSMVVFEEGRPKNSDYRKFKIKTVKGANDYQSMQEIIERRFSRYLQNKDNNFSKLPDVIFVDGGKGQVNAVKQVLQNLNISIPIVGIVKDDMHRTRGIIYNGNEINFKKTSEAFKLITKIQDEVHRFAIEYHRKLRKQTTLSSIIDDIEGIGKVRKSALFKKFGSLQNIKNATLEELESTTGFNKPSATTVYNFFKDKT